MSLVRAKLRRHLDAVILAVILVAVQGAGLAWTAHNQNAQQHANAVLEMRQKRQGERLEARLCSTLDRLGELKPPAGNPLANPSRAYDQRVHAALAQLAPDVGCRGGAR